MFGCRSRVCAYLHDLSCLRDKAKPTVCIDRTSQPFYTGLIAHRTVIEAYKPTLRMTYRSKCHLPPTTPATRSENGFVNLCNALQRPRAVYGQDLPYLIVQRVLLTRAFGDIHSSKYCASKSVDIAIGSCGVFAVFALLTTWQLVFLPLCHDLSQVRGH